jgi:hypothetical protein
MVIISSGAAVVSAAHLRVIQGQRSLCILDPVSATRAKWKISRWRRTYSSSGDSQLIFSGSTMCLAIRHTVLTVPTVPISAKPSLMHHNSTTMYCKLQLPLMRHMSGFCLKTVASLIALDASRNDHDVIMKAQFQRQLAPEPRP